MVCILLWVPLSRSVFFLLEDWITRRISEGTNRCTSNAFAEKLGDQPRESRSLYTPAVFLINLLPSPYYLDHLGRMRKHIFNSLGKILGVTGLKEEKRLLAEVVLNAGRSRGNYWFAQSQIFENPSWCIDLRKRISRIWNDPDITVFNFSD